MTIRFASAVFSVIVACAIGSSARADNYTAASNTAMSITGDISMDDFSIVFANGETLDFAELIADHFMVDGRRVPGSVFSVETPGDPVLENGNTLCGNGDVTYVASWSGGAGMTLVAVFTGSEPPASADEMCASYLYAD
ncbi:MAG: hypothetical protein ACOH2J_00520 [Allorhizobium sp.]